MEGKKYSIHIQTRRLNPNFDPSENKFNPVRDIKFDVFAVDEDMAKEIALVFSEESYGHVFDEAIGDYINIEPEVDEDEEKDNILCGTKANTDFSFVLKNDTIKGINKNI